METLHSHNPLLSLLFLHLLQFSSLSLLSLAYTLPNKYFINCGSNSDVSVTGAPTRNFISDENSGSFSLFGETSSVSDTNTSNSSPLYQTARIFTNPSSYVLQIDQSGTYMVRLHFNAFSSSKKILSNAQFKVSASGFSLLSNFSVQKLIINEFMLTINVSEFIISFTPTQKSSFAFANAIEVFLAPNITDVSTPPIHVTPSGARGTYDGLLSQALHTVYRANVGGSPITPTYDTLWRNWVSDDGYLVTPNAAKTSAFQKIMEVIRIGFGGEVKKPPKKHLLVAIGSVVGSVGVSVNVGSSGGGVFELQESKAVETSEVNLAEWGLYWQKKGPLENIVDPLLVGKINPNSLRKFGETVEKCLKEYGVQRPNMNDVVWDLEYALQLQQIARHREPHEKDNDSVVGAAGACHSAITFS
ncbi:putative receptor-like protein kinase [Camellia lanceoleosa]|uniref:Receptor-like protein kinase n=1 Tax=Camellia lanceoleosa TaxID=1840588 RepID=A0ACC0IXC8_9ERIC|nr:putative receptor-like protein kinase [Camellia lanceoleosa]